MTGDGKVGGSLLPVIVVVTQRVPGSGLTANTQRSTGRTYCMSAL